MFRQRGKTIFTFAQQIYNKIAVTRTVNEKFTFYLNSQITVNQFVKQLKDNFKIQQQVKIIAYPSFTMQNFLKRDVEKDISHYDSIKNQSFFSLIVMGDLYFYQLRQNNRLNYGIEILQLNNTTNRNLPEMVSRNIIELVESWKQSKTVGEALKKNQIKTEEKIKQQQEDKANSIETFQKSYIQSKILSQFISNGVIHNLNVPFIMRMALVMSINWAFLFGVTYGKYGWDVGEPLSYLTSLTVDLFAMMKWFSLNQKINQNGQFQFHQYSALMNLPAQRNFNLWLVNYHKNLIF